MLQVIDRIDSSSTAVRCHADPGPVTDTVRNLNIGDHHGRLADVLQGDIAPLLRQLHHGTGVYQTVAKLVVILSSSPVSKPPRFSSQGAGGAGHHHQVLHVPPGEARVSLQR